jgi:hypothetical protein
LPPSCSRYTGYGGSFEFAGDHADPTPVADGDATGSSGGGGGGGGGGSWGGVKRVFIVAMDAIPFDRPDAQYGERALLRELNKVRPL